MVSFLFHSKGNALFVTQQSVIQNHLLFTVLLEKMRDVATSMATGDKSSPVAAGVGGPRLR